MSIRISQYMAEAMVELWSAIFSNAKINVCSGKMPETPDTGLGEAEVLVTFQLPHAPFKESVQGETNLREQVFARAVASGFASWYRVTKDDGTPLCDGTVGTGTGQLHINSTQIIKGGEVILNSFNQTVEVA